MMVSAGKNCNPLGKLIAVYFLTIRNHQHIFNLSGRDSWQDDASFETALTSLIV
jgi:hypothetical protein